MQTHKRVLLAILGGLFKDTCDILELPSNTFQSDLEKVTLSVESRGIGVLLLMFPSLCSALERALDDGDTGPLLGAPFVKKGKPTILVPLFAKIFTDDGILLPEPCVESIRCLRQILRFAKKFRIDPPTEAVTEKYREFATIEEQLIHPVLSWGDDDLRVCSGFPTLIRMGIVYREATGGFDERECNEDAGELLRVLDRVQSILDRFTKSLKFREAWFRPKHGPGAVADAYEYSKYEFGTWPHRLERKFPFDLYGLANHQFWDGPIPRDESVPCKLIGVPKDYKGPRLIASEPICSQFIQQGILNVLRENVKVSPIRHAVDFRSQEPSRQLALTASEDGRFSTIDLSSASDRLSCAVVECAFRKNYSFLELLNAARTPGVQLPDGEVLRMKKFAAQGAAFTFPIQTIIYTLICMGVISYVTDESSMSKLARQVRVYGDDMIVPTDVFPLICKVLEALQLKVNHGKSFNKGLFRESCGMDAYAGRDVTPASVLAYFSKRDPVTLVSTVECSNNLFSKGFVHASRVLLETIPEKWKNGKRILRRADIAPRSSGSTVFGVLTGGFNSLPKMRWNDNLHRHEYRVLTVESVVSKSCPNGHSRLLQWFIEKPSPEILWEPGEVTNVKGRYALRWVPAHLVRVV